MYDYILATPKVNLSVYNSVKEYIKNTFLSF